MTKDQSSFAQADQFLLEIAEKRFNIEEDVNKTLQQKAPLILATVGFFSTLLGQFVLKILENWSGYCTQVVALALVALTLACLFAAATSLLPALFGAYSSPALPRRWQDHLKETRAALRSDKTLDSAAVSHLKHGYLDALIEATDKASAANLEKTAWIERSRCLVLVAVPLAALAVAAFIVQAIASPKRQEACVSENVPKVSASDPSPVESVSANPEATPAPVASPVELPVRPPNQEMKKSLDPITSFHRGEFFGGRRA